MSDGASVESDWWVIVVKLGSDGPTVNLSTARRPDRHAVDHVERLGCRRLATLTLAPGP